MTPTLERPARDESAILQRLALDQQDDASPFQAVIAEGFKQKLAWRLPDFVVQTPEECRRHQLITWLKVLALLAVGVGVPVVALISFIRFGSPFALAFSGCGG